MMIKTLNHISIISQNIIVIQYISTIVILDTKTSSYSNNNKQINKTTLIRKVAYLNAT